MATIPVALERYFFTRLFVAANARCSPQSPTGVNRIDIGAESRIDVAEDPDTRGMYSATLKVSIDPKDRTDVPYAIDIECVGFFSADTNLSEAERKNAVTVLSHSVLYGATREAVLWVTGRQAWGPLTLGLSVLQSGLQQSSKPEPKESEAENSSVRPKARRISIKRKPAKA